MVEPARGALYDARSLAWQVNRQWFVLLGGPRAAILQVCDPGVAAGVASFSNYRTDPLGRLERTLDAMLAISFGSPERREAVLAGLEQAHARVRGTLSDGTPYDALEPARQFWVLATLTDTVLEVDRRYLGRMGRADREAYYQESKRLAAAFGIPDELVPGDLAAFEAYMAEQLVGLEPTSESRDIAETLLTPRVPYVPGIVWLPLTLATTELLPTRMRRLLGIRGLNPAELAGVRAAQMAMRNSVARLGGRFFDNPLNSRSMDRAA